MIRAHRMPRAMQLALVVLLSCMTAACTLKRNSVLPALAPSAWQSPGGNLPVLPEWWKAFDDPVLTRVVEQALSQNTDLRLAGARVAEAKALSVAQHGAEWPTVNLGGNAGRSDSVNVVTRKPARSTAWQEQFEASYEIDLWGRVRAASDAADAGFIASQASRDAAALSVAAAAAATYIGLRALDERLAVAQRTLVSRASALEFARSRQRRGYASKLELAQAESEYRQTAQAVPQLVLAASRSEHALQVLLGSAPGPVERGKPLGKLRLPSWPDAGLPSDLLRRRPDIAASEALVVASDGQLAVSRAQLLPALRLSIAAGTTGASVLTGDPFTIWSVGGSVLAPLFNGGRLRAQVDASASRRNQAILAYEKVVIAAFSEVEDQLSALNLIQQQAVELDAQRVALEEALRIARNRHRAGYTVYLEELDAERSLFNAEQLAVQLRSELLVTHVNLYRALGGGWTS